MRRPLRHALRATVAQARGVASGEIPLLGSTTTMQMMQPQGWIIEQDERTRGTGHRILQGTVPPDGVSAKARGIPRPWRTRQRPTSLSSIGPNPSRRDQRELVTRCAPRASVVTEVGDPTSGRRVLREETTMAHHGLLSGAPEPSERRAPPEDRTRHPGIPRLARERRTSVKLTGPGATRGAPAAMSEGRVHGGIPEVRG